jgi:hypothetical protein
MKHRERIDVSGPEANTSTTKTITLPVDTDPPDVDG